MQLVAAGQPIHSTCPYCGVGCGVAVSENAEGVQLTTLSPTLSRSPLLNPLPLAGEEASEKGSVQSLREREQTNRFASFKIIGDKLHPANFGRLCSKGAALADTLDHDGRLLYPSVDGQRVSWDDALTRVAEGFSKIIAEHGPDAVAFYVSGQILTEDYYVANKLMKGFIGSANIDTNSRLCMSTAVAAHKRAFGADAVSICYEDVEEADLVVIVGSNYAWAHPVLYQRLAAAKKARPEMQVVVIDPRRTATCDIADLHLALAPGADAYLFSGLLHHLRREDALDLAYVEAHVEGFAAAFEAARSANSVPKVAQICGIQETQVSEFFRMFARTKRTVTIFSQGINQSSSGVDKANAIINVHLATGRIGKPGMGPFSVTGQPNAMGGREVGGLVNQLAAHMDFANAANIDLVERFWNIRPPLSNSLPSEDPLSNSLPQAGERTNVKGNLQFSGERTNESLRDTRVNIAQAPGLKAVDMFQAIASKKIKAVWIMATNPVVSLPDADKVRAALMDCELVVVSDCVEHTDTTACADILLPATGWGEKDGTVTNSERRISRQRALLPPAGEAKADWWIITQVAQRMGFAEAFPYTNATQIFREHARLSGFENGAEFENASMRAFDISALAELSDQEYDDLQPVQWPVRKAESFMQEAESPLAPLLQSGGLNSQTSSYSESIKQGGVNPESIDQASSYHTLKKGGQGGLAVNKFIGTARLFTDGKFYTPNGKARMIPVAPQLPAVATDADYPLVLNTGRIRDQWHTMTRTGKVPRLNAHLYEPFVQVQASDAQLYQLQDGGLARLTSRHGTMLARVQVSEDQRPGSVFVPMHWNDTFAKSARVDALVAPITDPISGQPESKHTPARVEPYQPAWQGFVLSRERLELEDASYCAWSHGAGYWRHEIAGETLPEEWRDWVKSAAHCSGDWIEYRDTAMGRYRAACLQDGRLEAVFFLAPDQRLPEREWLSSLFAQPVLTQFDLAGLLSARPPKGAVSDTGRIVCACFSVGAKTIANAIQTQGLDSVEAVGVCLKAGTGCGSCVPEIRKILEQS